MISGKFLVVIQQNKMHLDRRMIVQNFPIKYGSHIIIERARELAAVDIKACYQATAIVII
jgi:tagatose-1,6-bisphosphate aldolase non-catalytic subunit AgaZ/GatZ